MKLARPAFLLPCLLVAIFALTAWLLPRLIDSRIVRDKISAELSAKTDGKIAFRKIVFLWLPRPSVVIEDATASFGDVGHGSIRSARIYPSIIHLLTGRVVLGRALLHEPRFTIRVPAGGEKPPDLQELEKKIRSALVDFTKERALPYLELSDGQAEIHVGDNAPILLHSVALQSFASPNELRFELRARANFCEGLQIAGNISPATLAADFHIALKRINVKQSLVLLPQQIFSDGQGQAGLEMKIKAEGLRKFRGSLDGSTGPLVFLRNGESATIEARKLKGVITYQDQVFLLHAEQIDLATPRLRAAGQVKLRADVLSTSITARDLNLAEIGAFLLRLVDDPEGIKRVLGYVRAGTITELNFASEGRSLREVAFNKNTVASALVRDGTIFLEKPDLELQNVSGSLQLSNGVLNAEKITAAMGGAKGWDGKLRLGLQGEAHPFHLEIALHSRASELHSILLNRARDPAWHRELARVRNLQGELSGILVLGETLGALKPRITVSDANVNGTYDPVPFPIAIKGGELAYEDRTIRLNDVRASVGRSTFEGVGLVLHEDASRKMNLLARQASLDLQEAHRLLKSFNASPDDLMKIRSMRGAIGLHNFSVTGVYDHPGAWTVSGQGDFHQIEINHAEFPEPIHVARGKFAATHQRLVVSDATVSVSDARFNGGGSFDYAKGAIIKLNASGSALVGDQMTQRLARYVQLPDDLRFRSPLRIAADHFTWSNNGDIAYRGQLTVREGPRLTLDMQKKPEQLAVQDLTIEDGDRRARMKFQHDKETLGISFNGDLAAQTLDRMFVAFPAKGSSLRGDIQVNVALADSLAVSARGELDGGQLPLRWAGENGLLEKFRVEANGETILVRSAEVRWGESRATVAGTVISAKNLVRVDADVQSDHVDWQKLQASFGERDKGQGETGGPSFPAMEGVIRLKAGRFDFENFTMTPLETTVAFSPGNMSAKITRALVCGLSTSGRVEIANKDVEVDLQVAANDAQLEPTTVCLTNQRSDIRGIYSINAHVAGRGDVQRLRSLLKGNFEINSRDGEFVRGAGMDATFDYLNSTGDFAVQFPDLNKQTFPYRTLSVKGTFEGAKVFTDEIIIQSSTLTLTGRGSVDLGLKQVDVRGLVSVGLPANKVIRSIPIIGALATGSLVGIPLRVSGPFERPAVSYLSPADVGSELINLPLRILGAPFDALRLFAPGGENRDRNKDQ